MSYYDRMQKVINEQGGNVGKSAMAESAAQIADQGSIQELQEKAGQIQGNLMDSMGQMIAGKMGAKMLLKKFGKPLVQKVLKKQRANLETASEKAKGTIEDLSQESDDILSRGASRLQGLGSSDPGLTIRGQMDPGGKFREGDILPEDVARGEKSLAEVDSANKSRYDALSDADKQTVVENVGERNPGFRSDRTIRGDTSITDDEKGTEMLKNRMVTQDAIGDSEGGQGLWRRTDVGSRDIYQETDQPRAVSGQMGDTVAPREVGFSRETGLTTSEESRLGLREATGIYRSIPETAQAAGRSVMAAGEKTFGEAAMDALPGIGEAIAFAGGLGEGIHKAHVAHLDQLQDAKQTATAVASESMAQMYSGFNRPSFGSMALPSFDTSHGGSALLQE